MMGIILKIYAHMRQALDWSRRQNLHKSALFHCYATNSDCVIDPERSVLWSVYAAKLLA